MHADPQRLRDFELEKYFSRWEFVAQHHLTASDAQTLSTRELLTLGTEDDRARYAELSLGYLPTWGSDALREAIAETYDAARPGDVLAFAGAGEALFWACQLFVEPGDHVLCTVPNYQSIESVPLATGAELSPVPLWTERTDGSVGWGLDVDRVRSALRPSTRLLAVNFPNNPTGWIPPHADWIELLELCHEQGVLVVSDEVYRGIELDPGTTLPQACDVTPSALSINVLSKAYGLPGLRVGWAACRDASVLQKLERAKHYTSICNAAPSELLATVALRHGRTILERNRDLVRRNLVETTVFFERFPELFDFTPPLGGCVAFPRYLGVEGADAFCRSAVEEAGVLLLPGSIYRSELTEIPKDHFRIGIGRRDVPESLAQLRRHLERD